MEYDIEVISVITLSNIHIINHYIIHLLALNDAIRRHRTRSILFYVVASCLTAPSHYMNKYWLISEVLWYSLEGNFSENVQNMNHKNMLQSFIFRSKLPPNLWEGNHLINCGSCHIKWSICVRLEWWNNWLQHFLLLCDAAYQYYINL